ncbi:MAG TPA: DUF4157 domain-containing protein [Anaerolineae bacterium]|nr:DUF4157 domain-containing protein [Anaerolineae bacterium]HQI84234.1 DUF4157 domain-containing protein [Anaerolineae bacterium]
MAAQQNQHIDPVSELAAKPENLQPVEQELAIAPQQINPGTIQHPEQATPGEILKLQRAAGNRTVSGLIQAKLKVGPVGDQYEREADRVADQVMRTPAPVQRQATPEEEELQMKPLATTITPIAQRQAAPEEEEELQMKPLVQRQTAPEEEELQAKPLAQRQAAPEEEELQMKSLVQRQAEPEEEELQAKPLVQRQAEPEEEEELQAKPLVQRQAEPEEEEELQAKPLAQRQAAPEEEELQMKSLVQRQAEPEEEELQAKPLVQRQAEPEEEEPLQMKPLVQRQASPEEEEELQTKSLIQRKSGGGFQASDDTERQLHLLRGSGSPLPAKLRAEMEARFGVAFDGVRLHADSEAGRLNRNLRARAFTQGTDIYLGANEPDFNTDAGKRLLAHELTHVVQQTGRHRSSAKAAPGHAGDTVQRLWGKKKNPYKLSDAPTNPDEYIAYLKQNPDKLSDKERELMGIGPSISKDPTGYVKFLARNQKRLMSKKEQALFPLLVGQSQKTQSESPSEEEPAEVGQSQETDPYHDPLHPTMSPLVNKRPPDNPTPAPPSKWSRFKSQFSTGMRRRRIADLGMPSSLREQSAGTTGGLLQGPGVGTRPALNARPESAGGRDWKQEFDEPEEKKGDSNVDKMIEKLKAQLEMLEKLKGGD